MYLTSHD